MQVNTLFMVKLMHKKLYKSHFLAYSNMTPGRYSLFILTRIQVKIIKSHSALKISPLSSSCWRYYQVICQYQSCLPAQHCTPAQQTDLIHKLIMNRRNRYWNNPGSIKNIINYLTGAHMTGHMTTCQVAAVVPS